MYGRHHIIIKGDILAFALPQTLAELDFGIYKSFFFNFKHKIQKFLREIRSKGPKMSQI